MLNTTIFAVDMQSRWTKMEFAAIKEKARALFEEPASFISQISNEDEYRQALALMDELMEDYDNQKLLIDVLCVSIEHCGKYIPRVFRLQ